MEKTRLFLLCAGRSALLSLFVFAPLAYATVYKVGPDKHYKVPSETATVARNGDIIEIDAGNYSGDVAVWKQDNLILRGVGGMAHLQAGEYLAEAKAIWVIKGNNTTIEWIEFSGATVPHSNGAGIRLEGSGAVIRNCYFHDNENGILGGGGEVLIESSEFARNGFGDGYTHNMYISENTVRFTLRYSYSHHAKSGHNVKSRARENRILYNRIMDEKDGNASYAIDLPNGGIAYVIGNLIQHGPLSENSTIFSFAAEGLRHPKNELYIVNNTFVNDRQQGQFIAVAEGAKPVRVVNNIFLGSGIPVSRPVKMATNLFSSDAGLINREGFDYHLSARSPAINAGSKPGTVHGFSLIPVSQYVSPRQYEVRAIDKAIDIGAYEYVGANPVRNTPQKAIIAPPK